MKKIGISDLFEQEDIFKAIRDSADKTLQKLDVIQKGLQDFAKGIQKSFSTLKLDNLKDINQLIKLVEKSNELNKQAIALDKTRQMAISQKTKAEVELQMIEQQKLKTQQEQIKTQKLQQQEQSKLNKETEKAAKAAANQNSAYKQLEKNTRELKNQSKELGAQMLKLEQSGKKNTTEYQKLSEKYKLVTQAAQQGDAQLKKLDKTVGDNFRNVGNYQSAVGKLQNVLGQLGLAFGFGSIIQSASRSVIEFDQAIADLVSITGASGDDLEFFKEQSILLGKEVEGGASAVIEAYKLIGSAKPELLENASALNAVTESAIKLSQASGMELPEAATALTDAMNQFGAPAEDAARFIDALANGALFGSAEIPQVTEALLKFGAVANTANVSLEESTGLIEALAEKGLKGAEAGTALRNVMLKLSAPDALPREAKKRLDELGISFDDLQDTSKPFSERLNSLKPLLNDNAALVKVFGTENAVAATNLIANTNRIADLTEKMYTQGTASKQAEDRTQTLSHALTQLKGAWEEVILGFMNGSGTTQVLVQAVQFLAQNLTTILSVLGKVVIAYGSYKAMQLSLIAIEKARNFSLAEFGKNLAAQIPMTKAYKQAQQQAALATTQAGTAAKTAGSAMNAIPWMAIIGVVIELATAFYDVASGAKAAREAQEMLDVYNAAAEKQADKRMSKRQKDLDKTIAQLQRERNEGKLTEKEFLKRKESEIDTTKESIKRDIESVRNRKKGYQEEIKDIEKLLKAMDGGFMTRTATDKQALEFANRFKGNTEDAQKEINRLKAAISGTETKIKLYQDELENVNETQKDVSSELKVNSIEHEDNTGKINAKIPKLKEYKTQLSDVNEYLSKQNELLAKIDEIEAQNAIDAKQKEIDAKLQNDIKYAKESGDVQVDALEQLINEKYELEKQLVEQQQAEKIRQLEQQYAEQSQKERDELLKNRDELLSQEGLSAEKKKEINDNYYKELEQIQYNDLQRNADLELEKRILGEETKDELTKIEEDKASEINEVNDQLFQSQSEYYDKVKEESDKTNNELLEKQKQNAQNMQEYFKMATDYFIKQSNERIAQLDKEIEAAEKQSETLKTLAAEGNINAQQSLAEQERIIAESNLRKQQEQRKQQRLQLANSVFSTYASKVEAGSKNALAETIRDTTLLQAFINSIPAFYEGTEDTGSGGGLDGKGGFHAILHPHERVIPQSLNEKIGSLSNEQLTRIAQEYQNGKMVKSDVAHSSMELAILVNEMKDLKEIIRNKPETNIELGQITQSSMEIVERTRKGNTTVYNRFKVRS